MRRARWRHAALMTATGLVVGWGCGEGKPPVESSRTEATVNGKVTIRGKAATKGSVSFDPSNHLRRDVAARSAPLGPDGTYTITTLVGANTVRVQSPALKKDEVYNSSEFDVQSGENTFDISLPQQ